MDQIAHLQRAIELLKQAQQEYQAALGDTDVAQLTSEDIQEVIKDIELDIRELSL